MIKEEKQVTTQTIDASLLARMFLAGAKNLDAKKEWINELNVFPVPDGDTGTNMSMTIMSAAKEVSAVQPPVMKDLAKAIASGTLLGKFARVIGVTSRTIKRKSIVLYNAINSSYSIQS